MRQRTIESLGFLTLILLDRDPSNIYVKLFFHLYLFGFLMILAVLIYLLVCLIYLVDAQNNQNYSNNRFKHTQGVSFVIN